MASKMDIDRLLESFNLFEIQSVKDGNLRRLWTLQSSEGNIFHGAYLDRSLIVAATTEGAWMQARQFIYDYARNKLSQPIDIYDMEYYNEWIKEYSDNPSVKFVDYLMEVAQIEYHLKIF